MDMEQHLFGDRQREAASLDPAHDVESSPERRAGSRHMTVMRVARLFNRTTNVEGLGVIRNISSGGMMIDVRIPAAVGETIVVSMLDNQAVVGEVVWQDGHSIGMRFEKQAEVSALLSKPALDPMGKRVRLPRLAVDRPAKAQTDNLCFDVQLCDLSQRGAKIKTTERLTAHTQITLSMAECRPVRGTVRWRADGYAGIEFHRFLDVDELAQWLPVPGVE